MLTGWSCMGRPCWCSVLLLRYWLLMLRGCMWSHYFAISLLRFILMFPCVLSGFTVKRERPSSWRNPLSRSGECLRMARCVLRWFCYVTWMDALGPIFVSLFPLARSPFSITSLNLTAPVSPGSRDPRAQGPCTPLAPGGGSAAKTKKHKLLMAPEIPRPRDHRGPEELFFFCC